MNPAQPMKDPAAGVPPQLLPHLHLVSKHRYPMVSNLSLETIVGYLMEAPKIMRDLQPVQWQFLDPPPADGRLMLVWQPLDYLGTNFASDGYVWADAEHTFTSEVRGYRLEMFLHRSGYQVPGEPMANHSRRRYRLLPGNAAFGLPNPDPSLFIVHYSKASPRDHIPAASVPVAPHVQAMVQQRRVIHSQGQIMRKDFMLYNKQDWPVINPPQGMHGRNQSSSSHRRGASLALTPGEATLEEEEDVSRGDILDFMTPRDISRARYEQHHEWMEEILESHFATKNIKPSDLGLGRKGELEPLTSGFFEVPTLPFFEQTAPPANANAGRLQDGNAANFRRKASQKIAEMQEEIEVMKRKHAKRMEQFQKASALSSAEKRLRTAPYTALRTDGSQSSEDIVEEVERLWGTKVERVSNVKLVEKGGMEERNVDAALSINTSRSIISPTKNIFSPSGSAFALTKSGEETSQSQQLQKTSEAVLPPADMASQTPQDSAGAVSNTSQGGRSPSAAAIDPPLQPTAAVTDLRSEQDREADELDVDIDMAGFEDQDETANRAADQGADEEVGDDAWVMIDGDAKEDPGTTTTPSVQPVEQQDPRTALMNVADTTSGASTAAERQALEDQNIVQTESVIPQTDAPEEGDTFDMSTDFADADVDTAGDALAEYGVGEEDLNMDTIEDSAFGDAFHPPEDNNTPMEDS